MKGTVREGSILARQWPSIGRLQAAIRSRIVPLEAVAQEVPAEGEILEIGCGEGLVIRLIARAGRSITGVDFDRRKIEIARRILQGLPGVDLVHEDAIHHLRSRGASTCDAVIVVDTLSSFPKDDQRRVIEECRRVIRPGGTLVLKVIDGDAGWKTRFSKILSGAVYRIFRLSSSEGQRFHYLSSRDLCQMLMTGGWDVSRRDLHKELHHPIPHVLLVARRSEEGTG